MKQAAMHPADQIRVVMRRLYDQDLTTLTGGNLSLMDSEGVMWVSPSGIDKATLTRDDMVQVFPDGTCRGKHKPTSEYRIHQRILTEFPEFKAVLHAHPPALVAMSMLYDVPDTTLTAAAYEAVGTPGLVEYATPGTTDLVDCVVAGFGKGYTATILKNHAVFLASREDLFDAFRRFEQLDFTARLFFQACNLGACRSGSVDAIEKYLGRNDDGAGSAAKASATAEQSLRRELAILSRRAYGKRLFTGMCGIISARIDDENFIITPLRKDNASIQPHDFVRIEKGRIVSGRAPDRDWQVHMALYSRHQGVNSIIFAAPTFATTYALTDGEFNVNFAPE
ncbi:MAG: class II aldolase/adducin family protein, partial [Planctomycetes bacterium]|nr:class II aldolase/adducin family protein [Planctomycetota bacterium]